MLSKKSEMVPILWEVPEMQKRIVQVLNHWQTRLMSSRFKNFNFNTDVSIFVGSVTGKLIFLKTDKEYNGSYTFQISGVRNFDNLQERRQKE